MADPVCCVARIKGDVQAVGFRNHTVTLSKHFRVTGYVKNEPDGSVTIVAEGSRREIESFLDKVIEEMSGLEFTHWLITPLAPEITFVDPQYSIEWSAATHRFLSFSRRC